ncbi:MAG: type II toxin-antitoxin system HicA family toxin [Pseudomonadota bacterium]
MPRADKLLAAMRVNPAGDWRIADVETLCRRYGLACTAPRRGDHYKVSHAALAEILTIPAGRPIKPVYIRRLVTMVVAVMAIEETK